jgi:site-specific DNA-methyltransferase (adenine-specific)
VASPRVERIGAAELWLGDCREVLPTLGHVDAVVTDPPYHREHLPLYGLAAEHAARLLPPGGSFLALCGQHAVGQVIADCERHLRFWWLCGMRHNSLARLPGKWVCVTWKPAVWFVKESRRAGDTNCPMDLRDGGGADKEFHEWGQPVPWFRYWIDALSDEGGTILDPFMGSGTTGVACARLGRRFVGVEIEERYFDIACRRIEQAQRQADLFVPPVPDLDAAYQRTGDLFMEAS